MSDRDRKLIKSYQKEEKWQYDKMMKEYPEINIFRRKTTLLSK